MCVTPCACLLYGGPYEVVKKAVKTFTLCIGMGEVMVSVDRLKVHVGEAPVLPQQLPARG
jgi:hypothetical protein